MGRPKLYHTPEERRDAERRWRANASEESRHHKAEYRASDEYLDLMKPAYERYRQTEKYRASQRRYRDTLKAKATQAAYLAKARLANPERIKARAAIAVLVRRGEVTRPAECQTCGGGGRIDAHHHMGYAVEHWFDVQWLCRKCHKAAHA